RQALAPLERMHLVLPHVRNVYTKRLHADGSMVYVLDTANSRHPALRERATSVTRVEDAVASGDFDPRMVEAVQRGEAWFDTQRFVESGVALRGVYAPLRDGAGAIVGMIGMDYTEDAVESRISGWAHAVRGGTLLALAVLATLVGAACQFLQSRLGELARQRRQESIRDALTGVFNRRHFDAMLNAHAEASRSLERPLALLLLDADHFKRINDEHGHPGGDAVLAGIGRAIAGSVRSEDIPCRIGGEEFGIILPGTTAPQAHRVYARIAARLDAPVPFRGREIPVGISAGVAVYVPGQEDVSRFFARADRALYGAKAAGRGRCSPDLSVEGAA
ncbi:MAG: diguanylate cyclase, partial [Gammaproteobacteria bacterium]